jgi:o-succinylbenzoate synthase
MKIDRIDLFHVAMPLIYPWRTAYGEDAAIHSVLCRMTSGSCYGWGETAPFAAPCYSPEWAGGAFAAARDWLAPALIGRSISSGEDLQNELRIFKGNQFAKAALDTAWWSLHCRMENRLLHEALGATRTEVTVGADFGVMDSVGQLLDAVAGAVDQRFPRVKLKFRPGWDIPMLEAVRKRFPHQVFHIDCNSGYRLPDAGIFRQVDEFDLAMIEQPLAHDDLLDHAKLQTQIRTPVCLDESIISVDRTRQAIEISSCQYVNIKPGRVGGLTNAVAIHNMCRTAGIPCWVGGMLESAVGSAHCAALAMLDNFTYPPDIFPSSRFYVRDLSDPPLELHLNSGGIPSVRAPKLLPEPCDDRLQSLTLQSAIIKA